MSLPRRTIWNNEYTNKKVISQQEPRVDVKDFVRWLHREREVDIGITHVLDIGCGTGIASRYFANRGAKVTGIDISDEALKQAQHATEDSSIVYYNYDIASPLPFDDEEFDIALDVMTSNALMPSEMDEYIAEVSRVCKKGAYMLLRTFAYEGDKHARNLIEHYPGPEQSTYKMPHTNFIERVDTEETIRKRYESEWMFHRIARTSNYQTIMNRPFKRSYWVCWLERK